MCKAQTDKDKDKIMDCESLVLCNKTAKLFSAPLRDCWKILELAGMSLQCIWLRAEQISY